MITFTEEMQQRVMLAAELRSAGNELAHLGSQITGRRSVEPNDLVAARQLLRRASTALDTFEQHQASGLAPASAATTEKEDDHA